jgi:hypothetical protein
MAGHQCVEAVLYLARHLTSTTVDIGRQIFLPAPQKYRTDLHEKLNGCESIKIQ